MNIAEIKSKISLMSGVAINSIDLVRGSIEKDGKTESTPWLRHWDNDNRLAIILHEDVLKAVQASATNLIVKYQYVETDKQGNPLPKGAYGQYTICTATSIEATI